MLDYNQATIGKYIVIDNEPYEVLASHVFRKQQRKPVNQTKLRNLISGKVIERSFHSAESIAEADLSMKKAVFIYQAKGEFWFHDDGKPGNRFTLSQAIMADKGKWLKPKAVVDALIFNDDVIGIRIPIKVDLEVKEAPPAVRGNTSQGANKLITLETGAEVTTPIFINPGDIIRINTETGQYVERVEKK